MASNVSAMTSDERHHGNKKNGAVQEMRKDSCLRVGVGYYKNTLRLLQ